MKKVEGLIKIHNHFRELMKRGCFKTANAYIEEISQTEDRNILRTCMLLLKGLKERDEFKTTYKSLELKLPDVI